MCKMIPAVRIDKTTKEEIPEWLDASEIISTSTKRGSSGQVMTYVTCRGEYQHAINIDHLTQLYAQEEGFVSVDRGSLVNMNYMKEIDVNLKVAILQDNDGQECRTMISKSKMENVKDRFKRFLRKC